MAKLNTFPPNSLKALLNRVDAKGYLKALLIGLSLLVFLSAPAGPYKNPEFPASDSSLVPASKRYKAGLLRKFFIGGNYRDVWGTPVTMKIFRLKESGMKITELGGGQQTKSLRLVDAKGVEWVLRTVDKDVEKALPAGLRKTPAKAIVQDMISAAHPYAPLVVAPLAKALDVAAPDPQLFVVPDDPAFGPHQALFANRVVYLERRDPTPDFSETESSADVQEAIAKKGRNLVLQRQVLMARLLDMLIADWDRHADQWRWGVKNSAGYKYFYAIPRDRDQAFFTATGLIPRIGKAVAMKHINWFKQKPVGLRKLNYKSREFDRIYLNDLDEQEWQQVIRDFQAALSDRVIQQAVAKLPPEIYRQSGAFLEQRLKSRRDAMTAPVLKYYQHLAADVQVWGSSEPEIFHVKAEGEGVRVIVSAPGKKGAQPLEVYNRLFSGKQTEAIHLEGLGGNDHFIVDKLSGKIPWIHVYGMGGSDLIEIAAKNRKIKVHQQPGSAWDGNDSNKKDVAEN